MESISNPTKDTMAQLRSVSCPPALCLPPSGSPSFICSPPPSSGCHFKPQISPAVLPTPFSLSA